MNDDQIFAGEYGDEEAVDEAMEALSLALAEMVAEDESRTSVLNPFRLKQLSVTYKIMRFLMRGSSAKVTYRLHEPYQSMGSVSVTGKSVVIRDPIRFIQTAALASNFEAYPKTDGTVCLTFTFHNLTTPIE